MLISTAAIARFFPAKAERDDTMPLLPAISGERRLKFRYPLRLAVRYCIGSGTSLWSDGGRVIQGRVVNMSSGGILVASEPVIAPREIMGARVEMRIEWPCLLDERIPLQLFAVGRVLRAGASDFAAAFVSYQFRTMPTPGKRAISNVMAWPCDAVSAPGSRKPAWPGKPGVARQRPTERRP
jgi:hypothetical protein